MNEPWDEHTATVPDPSGLMRASDPDPVRDVEDALAGDHPAGNDVMRPLLAAFGCMVDDRQAVYLSAPITTGRRFVEWRLGSGAALSPSDKEYARQHRLHVIDPNRAHVRPVVARCRQQFGPVVIDPTALEDVPGWGQPDYHRFWIRVIERFASTVVFAEGWEFSRGCTLEFVVAVGTGARLLSANLTPLRPDEGANRVEEAVAMLRRSTLTTAAAELNDSLERLRQTISEAPNANRPGAKR